MFPGRFDRLCAQRDGNDRMLRAKILQMRVEHPEKRVDVARGRRNGEGALIFGAGFKRKGKFDFLGDEVNRFKAMSELVEKAAKASSMKANPIVLTTQELAEILRLAI